MSSAQRFTTEMLETISNGEHDQSAMLANMCLSQRREIGRLNARIQELQRELIDADVYERRIRDMALELTRRDRTIAQLKSAQESEAA